MDTVITYLTLSFIVSFLLGSIPWGVIVSKLAFHKDIRDEGSGNIGTTNAFRAMGKVGGALVFALDFGKGLLSGWLAAFVFAPAIAAVPVDAATPDGQLLLGIFGNPALNPVGLALALAFAGCTLGHIFSPWLKFKGGKAVSAGAAVGLMIDWRLFVLLVAVFGLMALLSKRASVCSMACAVVLAAGTPFFTKEPMLIALAVFTGLLVLVMHRANIRRLLRGEEPPFHLGSRKK